MPAKGKDYKTEGFVLRRTNYNEADRIVNFITPLGIKSALVRGARREKSKLAGGIEMFSLSDLTFHEKSTGGPDSLAVLTSARSKVFYNNILSSLDRLEVGSTILKKVSRAANDFDSPELFALTSECFSALNLNPGPTLPTVETYFELNLANIRGDDINLLTDGNGEKLSPAGTYLWDGFGQVFLPADNGIYTAVHIKLLRLMLASPLSTVLRVQNLDALIADLTPITRSIAR